MATSEKSELESSLSHRAEDFSQMIQGLKDELARLAEQAQVSISDNAGAIKNRAVDAAEDTQDLVRQNPLAALGIALGVGFVVGVMIPGRGRGPRHAHRFAAGSRREFDRLSDTVRDAIEAGRSRAQHSVERASDPALLDRLTGILSGLLESSRSTASSVASAGEKTARNIADRLSSAVS